MYLGNSRRCLPGLLDRQQQLMDCWGQFDKSLALDECCWADLSSRDFLMKL
jgi:hypothetical protein